MTEPRLLLLTPSLGFGGGIECVADAIAHAWPGPVCRVALYRAGHVADPNGDPVAKTGFCARALGAALRAPPDIVLANHIRLLPVAFMTALPARAEVRSLGHGIDAWVPMGRFERTLVRRSRPLAVSRYTAAHLGARIGMSVGAVGHLPLAVAAHYAEFASRPHARARPGEGSLIMLTVSRLVPENRYKGHFAIAEALPAIVRERPRARWVVVGDGPDRHTLHRRCQALGVERFVELRGTVNEAELADAYARADVFVLPSVADATATPPQGEGFGLVYAEAASFGLPSVASEQGGGALDFVEHEHTGLLAAADSADSLAQAVLRLANDHALRTRLGEAARERVLHRHLPEHFRARLVELLLKPE